MSIKSLIEQYQLQPHPEGGYYRETYRATDCIDSGSLLDRFGGPRTVATSIHYLLPAKSFSAFHRIKSDELWFHHSGGSLEIHSLSQDGGHTLNLLGEAKEESPFVVIPRATWFAARPPEGADYCFVSCVVAPGFEFEDFEMADRSSLIQTFPDHKDIITALTRA